MMNLMWEKDLKSREEKLDEQLKSVHDHIERLELAYIGVEEIRRRECEKLKEIEKKQSEVDSVRGLLEERLTAVEDRQKEFDSFQDRKMRELALREEVLSKKSEDFIKLADEKLREGQKFGSGLICKLESAFSVLEGMKVTIDGKFKEIEDWVAMARDSLTVTVKEADLIGESVEIRFEELDKIEREFNSFQEEKKHEFMLKEQELSMERRELLVEVKLRSEKLTEQQRLSHQRLKSLEAVLAGRSKEIEAQELSLNEARGAVAASAKEAELLKESANIRLREVGKREEEFNLYQEKRMRELVLEEEKLSLMGEEFIQEVMSREKKLDEQDKLVDELLEKLELAQVNVKDIKLMFSKRFKEIDVNKIEVNSIRSWLERNMNEVDVKEKELEHNGIKRKGKEMLSCNKKVDLEEQRLRELDFGEKNLISGGEFRPTCLNERLAVEKRLQPQSGLIEKHVLLDENEPPPKSRVRESYSIRKQIPFHLKENELKEQQLTDALGANVWIGPDESMDLKLSTKMERKTLERLIRKDLELTVNEISEVLRLSSDPAKLVLDAVELIFSNNFMEGDAESNVKRNCILVLEQLAILSPTIQPCVRGEAIKLASDWKSKMTATGENPLEALGFLHFLAAYNISSCFDKNGLPTLLMTVTQSKQTPELYRLPVLSENMPGLIQNLIQKKQYLLASMYIHEYKLEHVFPQAGVLNYSVIHSKHLAKEKCKTENNFPKAQDKAIVEEIAALRTVIEHIVKYGLEYAYSTDAVRIKINQLEQERASLNTKAPSTVDQEKKGQGSGSDQPHDANKWTAQDKHDVAKEAAPASKARLPERVALDSSSFAPGARPLQNKTRKRRATALANVHEPRVHLERGNGSHRQSISVEEGRRKYPRSIPRRHWKDNLATASRSFHRSPASKISIKDRLGR